MAYKIYKWEIKPLSSFLTPFHSDIIFGHIAWAINNISGQEKLKAYLKEFKQNNPPFIISNGFVKGFLPFYIKNPKSLSINTLEKFIDTILKGGAIATKKAFYIRKQFYNLKYINNNAFEELREENHKTLYNSIVEILQGKRCLLTLEKLDGKRANFDVDNNLKYKEMFNVLEYSDLVKDEFVIKNTINRLTGCTGENSLYSQKETYYKENICIYIKLRNDINVDEFKKYLNYIELTGYGKKASSGKGNLKTISFEECNFFKAPYEGTAFVTLSNYIPKKGDYEEIISGKTSVKYGKVSGDFSQRDNVFKKPFVYYEEGSIFKCNNLKEDKGLMLQGLNYDEEILQYGIPFIVGVNL